MDKQELKEQIVSESSDLKYIFMNYVPYEKVIVLDDALELIDQLDESEKEKKYYVIEPTTGQFLIKDNQQSNGVKWVDGFSSNPESYTEQEIKAIDDRFWAFAVPVEEEEE